MKYSRYFTTSFAVIVATASFIFVASAHADRLRYMDESGNIHWVDHISEVPAQYQNQILRPTPVPDEASLKWMEQRRREREKEERAEEQRLKREARQAEQEKKRRKAEEERRQRQKVQQQ